MKYSQEKNAGLPKILPLGLIEMDKFAHEERVEATLSTESKYH